MLILTDVLLVPTDVLLVPTDVLIVITDDLLIPTDVLLIPTSVPLLPTDALYFPPTCILSIKMEPLRLVPRCNSSAPTATIPANMSRRFPAIVISSTGN